MNKIPRRDIIYILGKERRFPKGRFYIYERKIKRDDYRIRIYQREDYPSSGDGELWIIEKISKDGISIKRGDLRSSD